MPDEPELLPCPHCGSVGVSLEYSQEEREWYVECWGCPDKLSKDIAIENWNKRVREGE